jgi:histidine triad (HIT) family protein
MDDCIFCRIVKGDLPSKKVYEDDDLFAFHDIRPVAPVHFMIIPKQHVASLMECDDSDSQLLGKILLLAPKLASSLGLHDGFRAVINTGEGGGQEVPHLHVHIFGGKPMRPLSGNVA